MNAPPPPLYCDGPPRNVAEANALWGAALKALVEQPKYTLELAKPRPFLVPSFDGEPVEVLPSEKANRKIRFDEATYVCEIENRFHPALFPENKGRGNGDEEAESYEIEIVEEGDDDADFYLEIVDGEVYYVFETEDDISVDSDEEYEDYDDADSVSGTTSETDGPSQPMQLDISSMIAPNLTMVELQQDVSASKPPTLPQRTVTPDFVKPLLEPCVTADLAVVPLHSEMDEDDSEHMDGLVPFAPRTVVDDKQSSEGVVPSTVEDESSCLDEGDHVAGSSSYAQSFDQTKEATENKSTLATSLSSTPTDSLFGDDDVLRVDPTPPAATLPQSPVRAMDSLSEALNSAPKSPPHSPVSVPTIGSQAPKGAHAAAAAADSARLAEADFVYSSPVPGSPEKVVLTNLPHSPSAGPSRNPESPVRSILKACPPSPFKSKKPPSPRKKKKEKDPNAKKTFTKTYVRAEHYDGEHRVYKWETPSWTDKKLRSTGMGEKIRSGGNLASPITFPEKKPWNDRPEEVFGPPSPDGRTADGGMEKVDKAELIRRIREGTAAAPMVTLPGYRGRQRKLKFSIHGAKIRDGGDIVKPITKATVRREKDDVNHVANPSVLRTTSVGSKLRTGSSLAAPITLATVNKPEEVALNPIANKNVLKRRGIAPPKKTYSWDRPEWAQAAKSTNDDNGEPSKRYTRQNSGIAEIESNKKKYEWAKPSWAKPKNECQSEDNALSERMGSADIASLDIVAEPPPTLRPTEKGQLVRKGEALSAPITDLPAIALERRLKREQPCNRSLSDLPEDDVCAPPRRRSSDLESLVRDAFQ